MNRALLVCISVILPLLAQVSAFTPLSPLELDMVQKGFLRRFGLNRIPDLTGPALPIPDHVWDIYKQAKEDENMDWIRHYYPKEVLELNSGLLVSYNLSASVRNAVLEEVTRADLKVRVRSAQRATTVNVYQMDDRHSEVVFLIEHPHADIYTYEPHSMSAIPLTRHQSFPLIVYSALKEPSRVRRKRAASPSRRDRKKQRKQNHRNATESGICQKKALYVDFEEIGWQEWILAPKSYEAGQCVGTCPHPLPAYLNATNHAIVQSLVNSLNPQVTIGLNFIVEFIHF
ncbi:unnamed protein product [Nippostrongylus brasiliensis]|uniref:Decapentaplegic protein homolog (inferred by orthology to a C. elegans protein) n=1 Tax=Nippostrongylus brasiliensis TaxID=27835 RepID=A0A0N4YIK3_NIPBR|nr:unnamed protein product [Nippostrongylus brasiliensis]